MYFIIERETFQSVIFLALAVQNVMHPGVCNLFQAVPLGSSAGNKGSDNATVSRKMEKNRRETVERRICSRQKHP